MAGFCGCALSSPMLAGPVPVGTTIPCQTLGVWQDLLSVGPSRQQPGGGVRHDGLFTLIMHIDG